MSRSRRGTSDAVLPGRHRPGLAPRAPLGDACGIGSAALAALAVLAIPAAPTTATAAPASTAASTEAIAASTASTEATEATPPQEADAVAPGGRRVRPPDTLPAPAPAGSAADPLSAEGAGPSGRELDDLTARVASRLRCPVCRSQSVLESSATLAEQMQREIRRRLAAGQPPEEVEAYFVSRYGEWILLQPEPRGLNLLVYLLPAAALLAGGLLVWNRLRAWTRAADGGGEGETPSATGAPDAGADGLSPEEEERVDALVRGQERPGAG